MARPTTTSDSRRASRRWTISAGILMLSFALVARAIPPVPTPVPGVGTHKVGDPATKPSTRPKVTDGASAKALVAERLAAAEGVLGDLLAKRSGASVASPQNLELGIDLRLLVRQALVQATAPSRIRMTRPPRFCGPTC